MSTHTRSGRVAREERRTGASDRLAAVDESAQIKRLDTRLGAGIGAKRERARLTRQIAGQA